MSQEQRQELQIKLRQLKVASKKIRDYNTTKKERGTIYPTNVGYPTYVRRPFRDLLKWMKGVEDVLESLIEEEAG